jgi:hypothetical protein
VAALHSSATGAEVQLHEQVAATRS